MIQASFLDDRNGNKLCFRNRSTLWNRCTALSWRPNNTYLFLDLDFVLKMWLSINHLPSFQNIAEERRVYMIHSPSTPSGSSDSQVSPYQPSAQSQYSEPFTATHAPLFKQGSSSQTSIEVRGHVKRIGKHQFRPRAQSAMVRRQGMKTAGEETGARDYQ